MLILICLNKIEAFSTWKWVLDIVSLKSPKIQDGSYLRRDTQQAPLFASVSTYAEVH